MPSVLPGFEYDVFISYRQKDNRQDGWVTQFVKALQNELDATFKEDVSIYFDVNPHDGLLETHDVDDSLKDKLKCLIFIPIISQTYCDPKSFAWRHEFLAFKKLAVEDSLGLKIKLPGGNVTNRILPVRIHDLDPEDLQLLEAELGGVLRSVDFIYKASGVNRSLTPREDDIRTPGQILYRDQVNKVANAIKEIIQGVKTPGTEHIHRSARAKSQYDVRPRTRGRIVRISTFMLILLVALYLASHYLFPEKLHDVGNPVDKSVAILPFDNLSGDPSQEYFSDGIAEEILNALSPIQDLKVPSRTSSFQFKGKKVDLREVGEKLHVSTVLEGSVRRQGDRLRINAELISVKDGYRLWSQQFDRKMDDVFAIQEEIARSIVQRLTVTLMQNEKIEIGEALTKSKEAYDAYLKGYYFWNIRQLRESEKYFKQAIALDSSFASAYAGLAETYKLFPVLLIEAPHQAMPKAREAAEKALKLDSLQSTPYLTLAFKATQYDWDREKARYYFIKSLSLNPRYAPAHYFYGQYLFSYEKDASKAILEMQKAVEQDPLGGVSYFNLGMAYMAAKRFEDAMRALRTGAELNKQNFLIPQFMGHCYVHLHQMEPAREAFELSRRLGSEVGASYLVYFYVKEGSVDKAQAIFHELAKSSTTGYTSALSKATAASFLGQKDLANQLFKKACEDHDAYLPYVRGIYCRLPNDLLSDPRNVALMEKYLPERQ
jgi:TolB-like protein/lipoprotein NlpI